jgi:hypothetical protein
MPQPTKYICLYSFPIYPMLNHSTIRVMLIPFINPASS